MSGYRRLRRKIKRKNVQIVVTEGLSEEIYLDRIRVGFDGIPIHTVNAGGGDIKKLKRKGSALVSDLEKQDMLAVVTDMDEKSVEEMEEFATWCNSLGIDLYVSNPSFEVFLLMHYQDVKGSMSQSDLEDAIGRHLKRKYDKAKGFRIEEGQVIDAINLLRI